jgi:hypothetical protein
MYNSMMTHGASDAAERKHVQMLVVRKKREKQREHAEAQRKQRQHADY